MKGKKWKRWSERSSSLFTLHLSRCFAPHQRHQVRRRLQPVVRAALPPGARGRTGPRARRRSGPPPRGPTACRGCCRPRRPWWPDRRRAGRTAFSTGSGWGFGLVTSSAQTSTSIIASSRDQREAAQRALPVLAGHESGLAMPAALMPPHRLHHPGIDRDHAVVVLQVVLPVGGDHAPPASRGRPATRRTATLSGVPTPSSHSSSVRGGRPCWPGCDGSCPGSAGPSR